MDIPLIGVPKTLGRIFRNAVSASWLLILWRLVLLGVFIALIGVLASGGPIGWLTAVAIFGALFLETIQQLVLDLWHARFLTASV